mmetsp:Transcript_46957/g.115104  ORF Transcript_46957/g.115104 Transcript_46957/m.115104 type:complete len:166 (-) Transcript_46957:158-655(-)|eukprot:CAMPEP_0198307384 /NCGR_PEP_ID=MMETSP1450-20131203/276_1 /TAXON_ID=753684 ORGANISM="Madagascaria erythrocladiodes, Strain CCMP3234" /NCGR_SAMPLE_ID=MMETSP1450 /ASSEMBLY_ACC=CAM_ASM_001115 /LENGTH=165 /DNA_ID=CAMNT_0044009963 /DNA_START=70 /DNA_END=567 /DNA_ORIENTATION=+
MSAFAQASGTGAFVRGSAARPAVCGRGRALRMGLDMEQLAAEQANRIPTKQLNTAPMIQVNYVGPKALDYASVSVRCPPMVRDFGAAQSLTAGVPEKPVRVAPEKYAAMASSPTEINYAPVITITDKSVSVVMQVIEVADASDGTEGAALLEGIKADARGEIRLY